jgi:hypothetical protein
MRLNEQRKCIYRIICGINQSERARERETERERERQRERELETKRDREGEKGRERKKHGHEKNSIETELPHTRAIKKEYR